MFLISENSAPLRIFVRLKSPTDHTNERREASTHASCPEGPGVNSRSEGCVYLDKRLSCFTLGPLRVTVVSFRIPLPSFFILILQIDAIEDA